MKFVIIIINFKNIFLAFLKLVYNLFIIFFRARQFFKTIFQIYKYWGFFS